MSLRSAIRRVAPVVALAGVPWVLCGPGFLEVDTQWALLRGDDLVHGRLPDLDVGAIPHPLAVALGVAAAPLGPGESQVALIAVALLSYGALVAGTYALGRRLRSPLAGVVAAAAVGTAVAYLARAVGAMPDVAVAAALVWAVVIELDRPRSTLPVLGLLAVAGLHRPEAWALAVAYLLYATAGLPPRARALPAALALSAPLVWVLGGVVAEGDPVQALSRVGDILGNRPEGAFGDDPSVLGGVERTWDHLRTVLHLPVAAGGLAAGAVAAAVGDRRHRLAAAAAGAWILGSTVAAAIGFPTPNRFLLGPAAILAALFASAALAWTAEAAGRRRLALAGVGLLLLVGLAATIPERVDGIRNFDRLSEGQARATHDLGELAANPRVVAEMRRCPNRASIPGGGNLRPIIAYRSGRPATSLSGWRAPERKIGVLFTAADPEVGRIYGMTPVPSPPGLRRLAGNRSWTVSLGPCA